MYNYDIVNNMKGSGGMRTVEERLEELAELFNQIPVEKQEGIVLGTQMLATLYSSNKQTA